MANENAVLPLARDWKDIAALSALPASYIGGLWMIFNARLPAFSVSTEQTIDYGIRFLLAILLTMSMAWAYLYVQIKRKDARSLKQKFKYGFRP